MSINIFLYKITFLFYRLSCVFFFFDKYVQYRTYNIKMKTKEIDYKKGERYFNHETIYLTRSLLFYMMSMFIVHLIYLLDSVIRVQNLLLALLPRYLLRSYHLLTWSNFIFAGNHTKCEPNFR